MGVKIGMDLGTSNVVAARMVGDVPEALDLGEGYLLPSYVLLDEHHQFVDAGKMARDEWHSGHPCAYRRFKLDMGQGVTYPSGATPENLTQYLVRYVKDLILGEETTVSDIDAIEEAIVSVPHGWNSLQREATLKAAADGGLPVKTLISEPVAAAAYYSRFQQQGSQKVLVCDMGGGTFDISLVEVQEKRRITVIDSARNEKAGDWADALIVQHFVREFNERHHLGLPSEDLARDILGTQDPYIKEWFAAAESLKTNLNAAQLRSRGLAQRERLTYQNHTETLQLAYAQLTELLAPVLDAGRSTVQELLKRNRDHSPDLIVLAGGMGKMLMIQEMVAQVTGQEMERLRHFGREADRAIARGAVLVAAGIVQVQEVLLHSIGLGLLVEKGAPPKNYIVVEKGTPIPLPQRVYATSRLGHYLTTSKPNQDLITVEVVYGEAESVEDCDACYDIDIRLPQAVPAGTPYDIWFNVDENGLVTVGVEGRGVDGAIWQGETLKTIRHYLRLGEAISPSE